MTSPRRRSTCSNSRLSLSVLARAAASAALPPPLRARVAEAALLRAALLRRRHRPGDRAAVPAFFARSPSAASRPSSTPPREPRGATQPSSRWPSTACLRPWVRSIACDAGLPSDLCTSRCGMPPDATAPSRLLSPPPSAPRGPASGRAPSPSEEPPPSSRGGRPRRGLPAARAAGRPPSSPPPCGGHATTAAPTSAHPFVSAPAWPSRRSTGSTPARPRPALCHRYSTPTIVAIALTLAALSPPRRRPAAVARAVGLGAPRRPPLPPARGGRGIPPGYGHRGPRRGARGAAAAASPRHRRGVADGRRARRAAPAHGNVHGRCERRRRRAHHPRGVEPGVRGVQVDFDVPALAAGVAPRAADELSSGARRAADVALGDGPRVVVRGRPVARRDARGRGGPDGVHDGARRGGGAGDAAARGGPSGGGVPRERGVGGDGADGGAARGAGGATCSARGRGRRRPRGGGYTPR